jgi:hypothetical protein
MTKITLEKFTPYERCPTCWRPNKAVTITKKEYDLLINCQKELSALYDGGVDNWEWYEESLREAGLYKNKDEEEYDQIVEEYLQETLKEVFKDTKMQYKSRRHVCDVKEEK